MLPEIKDDQRDGAIADGHAVLVEKDEIDELESKLFLHAFSFSSCGST